VPVHPEQAVRRPAGAIPEHTDGGEAGQRQEPDHRTRTRQRLHRGGELARPADLPAALFLLALAGGPLLALLLLPLLLLRFRLLRRSVVGGLSVLAAQRQFLPGLG